LTRLCQSRTIGRMREVKGWNEGELRKISRVWIDERGDAWLVVFDMAKLDGRIQCTGFAIRSGPLPLDDPREPLALDPESPLWDWLDPVAQGESEVTPRPLKWGMLREMRLGDILSEARRDEADNLRNGAWTLRDSMSRRALELASDNPPEPMDADEVSPQEWEHVAQAFEVEAAFFAPDHGVQGSIGKYPWMYLVKVAMVYQRAWRGGEIPPGRLVREYLGVNANIARKLIHRCREAGLLPPTTARKAEGWPPGQEPWQSDSFGPSRESGRS
jgi:hypothetical protein